MSVLAEKLFKRLVFYDDKRMSIVKLTFKRNGAIAHLHILFVIFWALKITVILYLLILVTVPIIFYLMRISLTKLQHENIRRKANIYLLSPQTLSN